MKDRTARALQYNLEQRCGIVEAYKAIDNGVLTKEDCLEIRHYMRSINSNDFEKCVADWRAGKTAPPPKAYLSEEESKKADRPGFWGEGEIAWEITSYAYRLLQRGTPWANGFRAKTPRIRRYCRDVRQPTPKSGTVSVFLISALPFLPFPVSRGYSPCPRLACSGWSHAAKHKRLECRPFSSTFRGQVEAGCGCIDVLPRASLARGLDERSPGLPTLPCLWIRISPKDKEVPVRTAAPAGHSSLSSWMWACLFREARCLHDPPRVD